MHGRWASVLFWTAIGLVATSFVLALIGEATSSPQSRELVLHWHEWLGLLTWVAIVAALAAYWFGDRQRGTTQSSAPPKLRRAFAGLLYTLLLLQPISGWLLASHEGKLASFFGWALPPLASPNSVLAEIGNLYHVLGGGLILLVAALSLRLNLDAKLLGSVREARRSPGAGSDAAKRGPGDGA